MFKMMSHKNKLKKAFSECFDPLKSVLMNVPIPMQKDRYITASILGTCRAYAELHNINEKHFGVLVDSVFEEVYRQNSMAVQNRAEKWLQEGDNIFMEAYYHAKDELLAGNDLTWLAEYSQQHFKPAVEVHHST